MLPISSALRHATEMANLIKMHELMASKHILVIVSDGGSHHRVTFGSVQVSSVTLFRALDLDMHVYVKFSSPECIFGQKKYG